MSAPAFSLAESLISELPRPSSGALRSPPDQRIIGDLGLAKAPAGRWFRPADRLVTSTVAAAPMTDTIPTTKRLNGIPPGRCIHNAQEDDTNVEAPEDKTGDR